MTDKKIDILTAIRRHAVERPLDVAYQVYLDSDRSLRSDTLTWKDLDAWSDALAAYLYQLEMDDPRCPLVVYGHKSIYMLVCFLACVKSGHAYCPVDDSMPQQRVEDIIACVGAPVILTTEKLSMATDSSVLTLERIREICETPAPVHVEDLVPVRDEETYYIIFTSGSTGKPKGVQITRACLENFISWGIHLGDDACSISMEEHVLHFLNQAPFSFDLSVMDVYLSLYTGGRICAVSRQVQNTPSLLYEALSDANIHVWVSTPSFADVCLSDPCFSQELLPEVNRFLFCGEILTNRTAARLREQFPKAVVVNTYGPTESTVAVTETVVDDQMIETISPLPVGKTRNGTWLYILDEQGNQLPEGERGEVVIVGDTVSPGYFKNPEQTDKVFAVTTVEGTSYRLYHTGDKGYLQDGQLYYCGRIDFQIKLHGYRIEIEDIENNLVKIPGVEKAAVIPNYRNGKVSSLTAYLSYPGMEHKDNKEQFQLTQKIRAELGQLLPAYMLPKKFVYMDHLPLTNNGKVDRRNIGGSKS